MTMSPPCHACRDGTKLPFTFTMAFQPIVDLAAGRIWGYEALVRGSQGQSAASVLDQLTEQTLYAFDQAARVRAIETAGRLFSPDERTRLSINFMPNAVYEPAACIRLSLAAARRAGLSQDRIMFEFTENEKMNDAGHISRIIAEYRRCGFLTALDDFGAGYAGLGLLARFQPDLIKIDMALIRNIDTDRVKQAILAGILAIANALHIRVLAEGVETAAEVATLREAGVTLFQGYHFARPQIDTLPAPANLIPARALELV